MADGRPHHPAMAAALQATAAVGIRMAVAEVIHPVVAAGTPRVAVVVVTRQAAVAGIRPVVVILVAAAAAATPAVDIAKYQGRRYRQLISRESVELL